MFTMSKKFALAGAMVLAAGIIAVVPAEAAQQDPATETAAAGGQTLRLEIDTLCEQGNTIFKVKNAGATWPKTSTFAIYRLSSDDGQVIAKRRMRLNEGQQASFRISAKRNPTGHLGIMVQPGWYEREIAYDATAACR